MTGSELISAPAKQPCGTCPYRIDTPSGVWVEDEYDKLPEYDRDTAFQPPAVFMCHQQNGRLCAGWVGCHDMGESLGLRLAAAFGRITPSDYDAALDYVSPVPLHPTGQAAAEFGKRDIERPSTAARRKVSRLATKLKKKDGVQ